MSDDAGGEAFLLLKCVVLNDRMKKSGNGTSKGRDGLFKHFYNEAKMSPSSTACCKWGNQVLTSGEQTFASLKRKLEGKCLWHFLEQWRYKYDGKK